MSAILLRPWCFETDVALYRYGFHSRRHLSRFSDVSDIRCSYTSQCIIYFVCNCITVIYIGHKPWCYRSWRSDHKTHIVMHIFLWHVRHRALSYRENEPTITYKSRGFETSRDLAVRRLVNRGSGNAVYRLHHIYVAPKSHVSQHGGCWWLAAYFAPGHLQASWWRERLVGCPSKNGFMQHAVESSCIN